MTNRTQNITNLFVLTELQLKVMKVVAYLEDDEKYSRDDAVSDLLDVADRIHDFSTDFLDPLIETENHLHAPTKEL